MLPGLGRKVEDVKRLLQLNADPNIQDSRGKTVLHWAAWHGDLEFIKLCMKYGTPDLTVEDYEGQRPVDLAAICGHVAIMQYLDAHTLELQCICRKVVRQAMGANFSDNLHQLQLPLQILLFLNYKIPYPGFVAVVLPPSPWTKEQLLQKEANPEEVRTFIKENASSKFLEEHSTILQCERTGEDDDKLFQLFQKMEYFKMVQFKEPVARAPRYSLEMLDQDKS